jgi:hypothetical protein
VGGELREGGAEGRKQKHGNNEGHTDVKSRKESKGRTEVRGKQGCGESPLRDWRLAFSTEHYLPQTGKNEDDE